MWSICRPGPLAKTCSVPSICPPGSRLPAWFSLARARSPVVTFLSSPARCLFALARPSVCFSRDLHAPRAQAQRLPATPALARPPVLAHWCSSTGARARPLVLARSCALAELPCLPRSSTLTPVYSPRDHTVFDRIARPHSPTLASPALAWLSALALVCTQAWSPRPRSHTRTGTPSSPARPVKLGCPGAPISTQPGPLQLRNQLGYHRARCVTNII